MPIYEYRCQTCNTRFEVLQRAGENLPPCPKCNGQKVSRLLSVFGVAHSERAETASNNGESESDSDADEDTSEFNGCSAPENCGRCGLNMDPYKPDW